MHPPADKAFMLSPSASWIHYLLASKDLRVPSGISPLEELRPLCFLEQSFEEKNPRHHWLKPLLLLFLHRFLQIWSFFRLCHPWIPLRRAWTMIGSFPLKASHHYTDTGSRFPAKGTEYCKCQMFIYLEHRRRCDCHPSASPSICVQQTSFDPRLSEQRDVHRCVAVTPAAGGLVLKKTWFNKLYLFLKKLFLSHLTTHCNTVFVLYFSLTEKALKYQV